MFLAITLQFHSKPGFSESRTSDVESGMARSANRLSVSGSGRVGEVDGQDIALKFTCLIGLFHIVVTTDQPDAWVREMALTTEDTFDVGANHVDGLTERIFHIGVGHIQLGDVEQFRGKLAG